MEFTIRNYEKGDEARIISLFKNVFSKEMTLEQWRWKYSIPGNGRIFSKLVEDGSGEIIGHAGAIPLRGTFEHRPIQFFQGADVMVHQRARGSLGMRNVYETMMKRLEEDIGREFPGVFFYGFSGHRPFRLGERIGVYENILCVVASMKNTKRSLLTCCRLHPLSWDDTRLNTLWARMSRHAFLALVRDRDYLKWRYGTNPFFEYNLLGCFLLGRLVGWAVTRQGDGNDIFVVDVLAEREHLQKLLKALGNSFATTGKQAMRLWLPEKWRKELKDFKEEETPVIIANLVWGLSFPTDRAREDLFYTMGDTDIF